MSVREYRILVRGAGEMATGVAHRLHRSGFSVALTERRAPLAIRRGVAFSEAVYEGEKVVEGVRARFLEGASQIESTWASGAIPLVIDEDLTLIRQIPFPVLVEATLSKKNRGISRELAPLVIALGPGFAAGRDAHVVIETMRGHDLGRILREGEALPDTGVPGEIEGYGKERMLRAPRTGVLRSALDIGSIVKMGHGIGDVSGAEIRSEIDGVLRGLLRNGVPVQGGQKIGDVDPRGRTEYCFTISDKARAVAGGVLEAILTWVAGK